jgi:hypothetical protein
MFSGVLAFALSFTLLNDDGRSALFAASVVICFVCLTLTQHRAALLLAFSLFLLMRLVWSAFITADGRRNASRVT